MGLEFYTSDTDVWYEDEDGMHKVGIGDEIVGWLNERITSLYPEADNALSECYAKSVRSTPYYNYLRARRFCKCNFSSLDHTKKDISANGFGFEKVPCPLRGECKYEGVICQPRMNTRLSDAEERVMRLVCEGRSNMEIADELFLSPNTIKRHISTAYIKTGTRNRAEFVKYAKDNNFFV